MRNRRLAWLGAVLLLLTGAGPPDISLADARAKGGQRLDREQMLKLIGERLVVERADAVLELRFAAGGRLNATASYNNGYRGDGFGTWRVSDDGRLCADITWPRGPVNFCRPALRLGDDVLFFRNGDDTARAVYGVKR
jgi:hypothetical protein